MLSRAKQAAVGVTLSPWGEGSNRGDLRRLELVHVRGVENLVTQNRGGRTIELPGGATVSRKSGLLTFNAKTSTDTKA